MKKKYLDASGIKHKKGEERWEKSLGRVGKAKGRNSSKKSGDDKGNIIFAPRVISIYRPDKRYYTDTISFIKKIKRKYGREKNVIDFTNTTQITAAAATVLYAEIECASNGGKFKGKIGWSGSSEVNKSIKRSNLSKVILGSDINYSLPKAEFIPIVSSVGTNLIDDICDHVKHRFYSKDLSEKESAEKDTTLGSAVFETVDNVCFHAYPEKQNLDKKWWLHCEVFEKTLYLAIYDAGVGIPSTVHEKEWFDEVVAQKRPHVVEEINKIADGRNWIEKVLSKLEDCDLIYISMIDDYSGTSLEKHGQGSKSIKKLVSDSENGRLWIFSGRGLYKFEDEGKEPELIRLPEPISGTLIQWNFKLP